MTEYTASHIQAEEERVHKARKDAQEWGWEALTPQAAAVLFGISAAAVRTARIRGHVHTAFTIQLTGKAVHMLHLGSALDYWGKGREERRLEIEAELERMRSGGLTMGDGQMKVWNLLHTEPIFG